MFSVFGIPGEEETTGLKLNTVWSVDERDQWEECLLSFRQTHHKQPLQVHVLGRTVHALKLTEKHDRDVFLILKKYHSKFNTTSYLFYVECLYWHEAHEKTLDCFDR